MAEETPISIPGIELHDVIGVAASAEDFLFVPALFDFSPGVEGRVECHLAEYVHDMASLQNLPRTCDIYDDTLLAYWVRARLPVVFGIRSLDAWDPCRRDVLDYPFLVISRKEMSPPFTVIPFMCAEGWQGPGLIFRSTETSAALKTAIASAFWGLLLQQPGELESFEQHLYDEEGGWYLAGYERGEFYCECDLEDSEDPLSSYHLFSPYTQLLGDAALCPDCGGSGEEPFFPAGEICESCNGTGQL